ncbi:fusaric acid resistance family protein [Antricoccus suffuscus]|uniref:Fusaric acid resistance family protein n=1 Tax=Antricoccus suffuscus TaxID=1629062 RepID=A0A2T0ZXC4_9ACTN|nr:FUSC family protein [Antricoccus suffuscus]PRZ41009.1 fusaric acid resistance family protein [Antricoccus suffuscus]
MASVPHPVTRAVRFLAVSDPGQLRLTSAAGTALTVLLTIVVSIGFTSATGDPVTVAMLGTVVSMQASVSVKDRTPRARIATTALMALPAAGAVLLVAALSEFGKLADVGFIAVLFTAVWARRFGPRGTALGMVSFISYFFALFLHATIAQVPVLLIAIAIGVTVALFVRIAIFRDRPQSEVRRLARALRAASVSALEVAAPDRPRDINTLRRKLTGLADTGMMIEDWLDRNNASLHLSVTSHDLSVRVFEAQIATEQLASALWALAGDGSWAPSLGRAMTAVGACLQDNPSAEALRAARRLATDAADKADSSQVGIATILAARTVQAHTAIHRITANTTRERKRANSNTTEAIPAVVSASVSPARGSDSIDAYGGADEPDAPEVAGRPGLNKNTRAAIQVAVATSAATVVGELISPNRWYWAVLTAFLVFGGVTTRGELLTKAGNRILGTVLGVVAGVLLAALVGHHPIAQMALIVVCVFFGFWLVAVNYSLLAFFITVLLALLYGLLGKFSVDVLELRIYETAAGAAMGIIAAFVVLPVRTRATVIAGVNGYLGQMSALIDESIESVLAPGGSNNLVAKSRSLDTALQDVVTAAKPLSLGPTTTGRRSTRRLLRVLGVSGRAAHALARAGVVASRAEPDTRPSEETADALRAATLVVQGHLDLAMKMVAGKPFEHPPRNADSPVINVMTTTSNTPGALRSAVRALSKLNRSITELIS